MAQLLGQVSAGTVVKINESGSPVNYLVVQQGLPSSMYDASCNGTWVLRQDIYENAVWDAGNSNVLPGADIFATMADMLPLYDSFIQDSIKTVKIPYCKGGQTSSVQSGENGLECKIFPLSGYEVGFTKSDSSIFPADGSTLSYFQGSSVNSKRVSTLDDEASPWWLRSPLTNDGYNAWYVSQSGGQGATSVNTSYGIRPAFVLPENLYVQDDGTVSVPAPTNFTYPVTVMQGVSIPLSWSAVVGADSYIVQRKVDSGGWTQVYSGSATTFTDTAGSWSTVQYQVCGVFDGTNGAFATSTTITILSASALVISGEDEDLGTITTDVTYSVATDTGNPISLTRFVNGIQVASLTVNSGFSYSIPVIELPTGSGTIVITATVQASSGPVTQTRTWTYTKTPVTFPDAGAVGVLAQGGQNVLPVTAAEAVRVSPAWGGSLDKALDFIRGPGSIVQSYPIASGQTVTAGQVVDVTSDVPPTVGQYVPGSIQVQNVPVGSFITRTENGVPQYYLVVHQGIPSEMYDASCNGTWVLRLNIYEKAAWDTDNSNVLPGADIFATMAGMLSLFDAETQAAIKTVKIPYCVGGGQSTVQSGANGLQCQIFPLSFPEMDFDNPSAPDDGSVLSYFDGASSTEKVAMFENTPTAYWSRSPFNSNSVSVFYASQAGSGGGATNASASSGIRPAFILDPTLEVNGYYAGYTEALTTSGTPSQAIALQGGSAGDTIPVIFSGVAQLSGVTQGQQITSPGVRGFGAMDGWLSVTPYWTPSSDLRRVTGSYVGSGTYGQSNPNSLVFNLNEIVEWGIYALKNSVGYFESCPNRLFSEVLPDGEEVDIQIWSGDNTYSVLITRTGNKVSWYSRASSGQQLNDNNYTYYFYAIGY